MAKFTSISTSGQDPAAWEHLCPPGGYAVVNPNALPPFFSSGLLAKVDSVVLVNSGTLFMVDFLRVDRKEIDQQPFAFIFPSGSPPLSGGFLDHGNWSGRTVAATPAFLQAVSMSGIGNCTPFSGLPNKASGPLSDLNESYHAAFRALEQYVSGCLASPTSN